MSAYHIPPHQNLLPWRWWQPYYSLRRLKSDPTLVTVWPFLIPTNTAFSALYAWLGGKLVNMFFIYLGHIDVY